MTTNASTVYNFGDYFLLLFPIFVGQIKIQNRPISADLNFKLYQISFMSHMNLNNVELTSKSRFLLNHFNLF